MVSGGPADAALVEETDVSITPADDPAVNDRMDAAYWAEYGR
ncbi:hypothetical protein ACFY1B_12075 [Streptomyces mirabilis]